MSPSMFLDAVREKRFPRVSGDEPLTMRVDPGMVPFSPRERG